MSAQRYIRELYEASCDLSDVAIREAIEEITQKRISEIRNTATAVEICGKSYYVATDGDDENDGLSPATPWKSLERVSEAEELSGGDGVFFRRGDLWRGKFFAKSGVTYSAYGEGEKPKLYGSVRNAACADFWEKTDAEDVWEYAFAEQRDIGNVVFDEREYARKIYRTAPMEDGRTYEKRDKTPFADYRDLREDMTFFHDYQGNGKLYLKCKRGNPGAICESLELAPKITVVSVKDNSNVTIDNLHIAHANFGVSAGGVVRGLTVQNCEICWIGGSIMRDVNPPEVKIPPVYGNGIEIYGGTYNFTVRNNYIWQVFDAAATHQFGRNAAGVGFSNIKYLDNVIEHSVYSIEIFLGDSTEPDRIRKNEDTCIENNILRMGGGFGHFQRSDHWSTSLIRNGRIVKDTKNYIVRNNIFDRSRGRMVLTVLEAPDDGASMAQYFDNIYVHKRGKNFAVRGGKPFVTYENTKSELEALGTEYGAKIIITDNEDF